MKLELKHLAPYLPYGLKAEMLAYEKDYVGKQYDEIIGLHEWSKNKDWVCLTAGGSKPSFDTIKPILRPLSDLTKEIEVNGEKFVPYDYFYDDSENDWFDGNVWMNYMFEGNIEKSDIDFIPYYIIQKLFEWHFDVFELIENRLAVDINTIKN